MEELKALLYDIDKNRSDLKSIHDLVTDYVIKGNTVILNSAVNDLIDKVRSSYGDYKRHPSTLYTAELHNSVLNKSVIDALIKLCK